MKKLFVYGTLRPGHMNSARLGLEGSLTCTPGVKLMGYELYNLGWFPGIRPGQGYVVGDLFDVPDDRWNALDSYEGAPNLYTRESVTIGGLTGVQVYVYHKDIDPEHKIASGDWFNKEVKAA